MKGRFRRVAAAFFLLFAAQIAWSGSASAYSVRAFGQPACHETMTRDGFLAIVRDGFDASSRIPLPADDTWRDIAAYLGDDLWAGTLGEAERFALYSLVLGARFPDLGGASATDIHSLREIHRDPEGQDSHFLRDVDDDFAAGDATAIEKGRQAIREALEESARLAALPMDEQLVAVDVFVELYGSVRTEVWGPGYAFGIAAHAVEDSFSHAVRSDDLRRVRQVANYIDAVAHDYGAARDGVRHSWAMDDCAEVAAELAQTAKTPIAEFFSLLHSAGTAGWPEPGLSAFFDKWTTLEPGCDRGNDFCDSTWTELALADPSVPIVEELFSCSAVPRARRTSGGDLLAALAVAALLLGYLLAARRSRGRG